MGVSDVGCEFRGIVPALDDMTMMRDSLSCASFVSETCIGLDMLSLPD